ncbi:hypothetical protein NVS89_00690 [Ancylobacter sp. MQZ15Z-1]|uniref:Uncharacterized protein n=1 Tax=Ancylobacter mangrovi TaxID=2972472 RepID=A0A9X2PA25_9HYPH|nr:hypothetical protein [Ancylobacter mangrovi]MCS0493594.1 hypothetical protein [Ancylobacter mangrovi]
MRKTFLIAIIALPVVVIGGYLGLKGYVAHFAERQIADLFGELKAVGVEASYGSVSYDVFEGRFELDNVSFAAPGEGTLKVGSFLAFGLEERSPSRVFAKRVELNGVAFDGPLPLAPATDASYRAPHIEVDAFEAPVELSSPDALPWQLALAFIESATAERIAIPESTTSTWTGEDTAQTQTDIVHGATTLEQLAQGRIAKASVEPSHFSVKSAEVDATGTVGRIDAASIDVAAMLILLDPDRRQSEQDFRTLYGSLTIDGYQLASPSGIQQGWHRLEIKDVEIKPSAIPTEDLIAASEKARDYAIAGERLPEEDKVELLRAMADVYDGLRIGSITFSDLTSREPDGGSGTLASLKAGPLADGRLDHFTLDDFKGTDGKGAPLRIGHMALTGLRPGAVMEMAADSMDDPDGVASLSWFMQLSGLIDSVDLTGAAAPSGDKSDPLTIDRLALSFQGEADTLPTRFSASLRMSGPTSAIENDKPVFALVPDGMKRASVAVDLAGNWDEDTSKVTLAPLYIEVSDAFSLSAKMELSDVDESVFSAQPDEVMAGALQANVKLVELTVRDSGIYERKLHEAARQQNLDPASIRQLFAGFAELLLSQAVSNRPELEPAVQSFIGFIQQPMSTLALRITPRREPLPVEDVVKALQGDDPLALVDELNFAVMDPLGPPGVPTGLPPASSPSAPMPLKPTPLKPTVPKPAPLRP